MMLVADLHLDLAMNALEWNRDLVQPVVTLRRREAGQGDKPDRGRGTVSFPEMRRGGVGLCVATQIARVEREAWSPVFGWRSPAQAWAMTQAQLAWYRAMEEAGELVQIRDRAGLDRHLAAWDGTGPIGYVLSLEGADSLLSPAHLERAVALGLRAIGPAHYGPGVYAMGTNAEGGLPPRGRELLGEISRLGLILDVTHLNDACFWEALDLHDGPVWASHQNCRALVPDGRQFTDAQLRAVIERGGIVGTAFDAWMLVPGWVRGETTPEASGVALSHVVDHVDRVCQLAGNARHAAIGSDLDGAFGTEQVPRDLDTIADLARLPALLASRGYGADAVAAICSGNVVRALRAWLPATEA
jgi:membrane dipeptidase